MVILTSKKPAKNNDIAFTGQYLGVVEEYLPDEESTFVKEGQIFASKTGLISIDDEKREIEIKTLQEENRRTVEIGDIVIGTVMFLRKFSIGINFNTINQKIQFNSSYMGNIHVSQISNQYIEKIKDAFQITDIIRAKVAKQNANEFTLTTVGKNLGVIHADCSICGTTLKKVGFNKIKCPFCGSFEKRKIAADYDEVLVRLRF